MPNEKSTLLKNLIDKIEGFKDKTDILQEIIVFLKNNTKADSVGIRLKSKGDYPYYTTLGFSNYFVKMENFLCKRDKNKFKVTDKEGKPILECMCGAIISKKTEDLPCFTKFGSFISNDTSETLKDYKHLNQYNLRGRCNECGYKSVLIVPIPAGEKNAGLIQLNSYMKNAFEAETIETVENIAKIIGTVFVKLNILEIAEEKETNNIIKKNIYRMIKEMQDITKKILTDSEASV